MKLTAVVRPVLGAAGLVLLAIAYWQWRIIAGAPADGPIGTLCSDLYTQYIPVFARAASALRGGHVPLWNPDQLAGTPMLPTWHTFGVFYPLNVLHWLVPVHLALGWTTCLHIAVAGAGMYWLVRTLGLSAVAGWFAAVTYMLSRPLLFEPNLYHAAALAPAVLAAWVRVTHRPPARSIAVAALLTALQLSTGGTQIVVYTAYAVGLLVPFTRPRGAPGTQAVAVIGAGALAIGLSAAFLLPATAASLLSTRNPAGLTLEETLPFPPTGIMQLLWELLSPAAGLPRAFFGWTALGLAILGGLWPLQRRGAIGFVLILALGVVLVLGTNTPFYAWYHALPSGNWFREPRRGVVLVGIGVTVLSAFGIERLRRLGWPRFAAALLVLPIIELFHATWSFLPHPQARTASTIMLPEIVNELRTRLGFGRAYIVVNWQDRFPLMEKLGTWARIPIAQDYDSLTPAIYGDYFRTFLTRAALVDPIFSGRYFAAFGDRRAHRGLDLLSVDTVVAPPGSYFEWAGRHRQAPPGAPLLLENETALPRAFIVHRVETARDAADMWNRLASPTFNPATTAVVVGSRSLDRAGDTASEWVEVLDFDTDAIALRAFLTQPGLLVLTDLVYPGWTLQANGQPQEIVTANGMFRAAWLDAGDHRLEFSYHPPLWRIGLAVTSACALISIALLLWPDPFERISDCGFQIAESAI